MVATDPARPPSCSTCSAGTPIRTGALPARRHATCATVDPRRRPAAVLVARHDAVLFDGTLAENLRHRRRTDRRAWPAALGAPGGRRGRRHPAGRPGRPRSASAGGPCPAVSDNGSPWPVPWPPSRRCWCCTTRPPRSTRSPRTGSPLGFARHRAGRSTLLVTSSPALLARCDRVLLVADGAVTADGTHADLVADPALPRRRAVVTDAPRSTRGRGRPCCRSPPPARTCAVGDRAARRPSGPGWSGTVGTPDSPPASRSSSCPRCSAGSSTPSRSGRGSGRRST